MKKQIYMNNVYTLVGTSFLVLVLPVMLKLIRESELITVRELALMILVLTLSLYCYIQSFERIIITDTTVEIKSLFETHTYAKAECEFVFMGKTAKRSLAGSAYGIEVKNKQSGEQMAIIDCYAFQKRYKQIKQALQ